MTEKVLLRSPECDSILAKTIRLETDLVPVKVVSDALKFGKSDLFTSLETFWNLQKADPYPASRYCRVIVKTGLRMWTPVTRGGLVWFVVLKFVCQIRWIRQHL